MSFSAEMTDFGLVALAGLLGGAIGIERELADKPAGLRTHIFVAAGAALLVVLGETALGTMQPRGPDGRVAGDPIRVIQAIVVGISFLGAGTIIHRRDSSIEGLTTAASIFLTAGIGIAVALLRIWLAVGMTLFGVLVLTSAPWIEGRLLRKRLRGPRPADEDAR